MLTNKIRQTHKAHKEGKINYLPLSREFGKLADWFPGIVKGDIVGITGTPSSGKTAIVKKITVHDAVAWAIKFKKNLRVLYFGLEESDEEFDYSLLSYQVYRKYALRYNIRDFMCIGREVRESDFPKLDECEKNVEIIKQYVTFISDTYNTTGIIKRIREEAAKRGKFYNRDNQLVTDVQGAFLRYEPDDPDEFVLVVIDHVLDMIVEDKEKDLSESINNIVHRAKNTVCKKLQYAVVIVQHQDNSVDNFERRQKGDILCSIPNLARNKEIGRQYKNLIGVNNLNSMNTVQGKPNIGEWDGYKIVPYGPFTRCFNVIKNRFGIKDVNCLGYFDGRTGHINTLPPAGSEEERQLLTTINNYGEF